MEGGPSAIAPVPSERPTRSRGTRCYSFVPTATSLTSRSVISAVPTAKPRTSVVRLLAISAGIGVANLYYAQPLAAAMARSDSVNCARLEGEVLETSPLSDIAKTQRILNEWFTARAAPTDR